MLNRRSFLPLLLAPFAAAKALLAKPSTPSIRDVVQHGAYELEPTEFEDLASFDPFDDWHLYRDLNHQDGDWPASLTHSGHAVLYPDADKTREGLLVQGFQLRYRQQVWRRRKRNADGSISREGWEWKGGRTQGDFHFETITGPTAAMERLIGTASDIMRAAHSRFLIGFQLADDKRSQVEYTAEGVVLSQLGQLARVDQSLPWEALNRRVEAAMASDHVIPFRLVRAMSIAQQVRGMFVSLQYNVVPVTGLAALAEFYNYETVGMSLPYAQYALRPADVS